jgi:serine/threonine protein kinase
VSPGTPSVHMLKRIASSLISALWLMKSESIIHCDIKPENVFVQSSRLSASLSRLTWADIPDDASFCLGDFNSSVHSSEAVKLFADFAVQSLPYRSPEVLLGVPFSSQIDVWSVGIILAELFMGSPLLRAGSPRELFAELCDKITPPPQRRFAGGKFAESYYEKMHGDRRGGSSFKFGEVDFAQHLRSVSLLLRQITPPPQRTPPVVPSSFVHLVAGLLHPDPDSRLSPGECLQHPFLDGAGAVSAKMLATSRPHRLAEVNSSVSALRRKRRRVEAEEPPSGNGSVQTVASPSSIDVIEAKVDSIT